jgi:hypothetical protein
MNDPSMFRREVLVGLGVAAAGLGTGASLVASVAADGEPARALEGATATDGPRAAASPLALPPRSDEVDALFGPIGPGTRVGEANVVAVHGVRHGAVPVVLEHAGQRFAVEVFREESGGAPPVVRAAGLALFLVNDGTGHTPTSEAKGLAVIALGRALAARREGGAPLPGSLEARSSRVANLASYEIRLG